MLSHQLGFASSWKMLTRDRGWIKPVLVLALIGWIPVLGQIALLGYAYEWARLTAWGVDSAPKQGGVAYGKVLGTGWRALLVAVAMSLVVSLIDFILFGNVFALAAFPAMTSTASAGMLLLEGGASLLRYVLMLAVNLLLGTFVSVAVMRSVIYDSFSAGWRLDRIFQMIGRDVGGFFKVYATALIAGLINWLFATIVSFVASLVLVAAFVGAVGSAALSGGASEEALVDAIIHSLVQIGPTPLLLIAVLGIAVLYVGAVLGTALELVSVNAVGQWFCRFDVARWGTSSDPLPVDVPVRFADATPQRAAEGPATSSAAVGAAAAAEPVAESVKAGQAAPVASQEPAAQQPAQVNAPQASHAAPDASPAVEAPAVVEQADHDEASAQAEESAAGAASEAPAVASVKPREDAQSEQGHPDQAEQQKPEQHVPAPWDDVLGSDAEVPDLHVEDGSAPADSAKDESR